MGEAGWRGWGEGERLGEVGSGRVGKAGWRGKGDTGSGGNKVGLGDRKRKGGRTTEGTLLQDLIFPFSTLPCL